MTFEEFIASDPAAKAKLDGMLTAAKAEGRAEAQAVAKKVGIYLTSEVYSKSKPIVERALKAIAGEASVETVESAVAMFDLMAEQRKQEQAAEETEEQGETPPIAQAAGAELMAQAAKLKIDVAAVDAYAKAHGIDPIESLKAAIADVEQRAKDAQFLPTGEDGR